jgi:CheY-like chemotaxis protein
MAEFLLATRLDPTQQRYMETLVQSAKSLLNALNDVLDFSKLETGRFELKSTSFDLHDLVQEVAGVMQARANEKGLTSGVDIAASCPRAVMGDAARVRQILMSLIEAALRMTQYGSVRLHVSAHETDGRLMLRFDVTDTGSGLSKAERERLFQPSVQTGHAGAGAQVTGLGLYIARRLAGLMGGELSCDSVVGQGTLYWFTLPTERVRVYIAPGHSDEALQVPLSGHVLVIEGNAVNRMLIGAYLDEFGLTYEMVDSGGSAIMALGAKSYDLVLMDVSLPDLDGIETVKRIRSLQAPSRELPIVAVTGKGDGRDLRSDGVDALVSKPIRGRELYTGLAPFLRVEGEKPAALAG